MEQRPFWEANQFSASQEIPRILWNRRFITAFTSHLSLSWARSIQSMPPQSTCWRSILILFSHLYLGLPSGLFPSGFTTKTLYAPLLSQVYATWTAHLILLDLITRKSYDGKFRSSWPHFVVFLHSPATLSLSPCKRQSFTPIRNHEESYISVYLNLLFLDSRLGHKRFCTEW